MGLPHCNEFFKNQDEARRRFGLAIPLLKTDGLDYLWERPAIRRILAQAGLLHPKLD